MKYTYICLALMLFACGSSDDGATVEPPIANNDSISTLENTAVTISVLDNDTLKNNASLDSFDNRSVNNGTVVEASNKLIYTPAANFIGTDTFTYTICDGLSTRNCATATVTVTVTDLGDPVAVNDAIQVTENTSIDITTLLDNDTLADGATLTSVDDSLTNGTIVLNTNGTVTYTAANGFSGDDTFTYTICDNDPTPTCSTATVTVSVEDEGSPVAVNDEISVLSNQESSITSILNNDDLTDDAVISSINNAATQGNIVLNNDGTITYTPQTNFTGQDTFIYTICDDDTPTATCSTATVTINVVASVAFNIPSNLQDYYKDVLFVQDTNIMFDELEEVTQTKHTTFLSYGQRHNYLYNADEDLSNVDNVILMYSGESRYWEEYASPTNPHTPQTFNTEHIYPQSLFEGGEGGDAKDEIVRADLHHLRVCDENVNSQRSNYPYRDGSGGYLLTNQEWFPGDEWKGDVARMILYLNVRYGETFNKVGSLELFLKWNIEDPVSAFEMQRNEVIYAAQGNRNPFIDNPYLATLIWGGNDAQNTWQ